MELTREQEDLLGGKDRMMAKAMRIIVALGKIYGADRLIPITWAHVAGASYKTVGDPGLKFIEEFARSAKVKVRTTVNPIGMDEANWREMGVPEEFAEKQLRILQAYRRMGVEESWTCTPYLSNNLPETGEHVAWAESSAVLLANSLAAARTNREGGPSALASAITGWTAYYGLHLDGGRKATAVVEVETHVEGYEYGLLGYHVGRTLAEGIPFFRGIHPDADEAKALAASLGASSECAMFHIEEETPEWRQADSKGLERLTVSASDLREARERLTNTEEVDVIVFGSPQLSPREIEEVAALMARFMPTKPVLVFTSRWAASQAAKAVEVIKHHGGRVVLDTCPEVTPLELFSKAAGSPSGKAAIYLPTLCGQRMLLADPAELMRRGS